MIPAYHWIHGQSSFTVRKYPSAGSITWVSGQAVYLTQGRMAEPSAGTMAKLIGVTTKSGASTAGNLYEVYDDPFIIYKADLDQTVYTDATAAGSGVFTATHYLDIGCFAVHSGATTTASKGLVYRVSAISTSTTFTLTEPDGAGTATIASGDTCMAFPRIGGICIENTDTDKISSAPGGDGVALCVDYSRAIRPAISLTNVKVNYDTPKDWAYLFVSYAHKHTCIAGAESAA